MSEAVVESRGTGVSSGRLLALASVAYAGCAIAIAPEHFRSFLFQYVVTMVETLPMLVLVALAIGGALENPRSPISGMRNMAAATAGQAGATLSLFLLGITSFTTLKFAIPDIVPFYADQALADLDELLHRGVPWRLVHDHTPAWAHRAIEVIYSDIWFLQWFGMIAFVAFWQDREARLRYLWAFALTMVLVGTLLATAMSSVGPIFYDHFQGGDRFGSLLAELRGNDHGEGFLAYARYLLASYEFREAAFGTGISAMPSLHVAIAVLNAWFLGSIDRRLGFAGWVFAAVIFHGSIYSGWHYAVDGYLSAIVATAVWWACRRASGGAQQLIVLAAPAGR